LGLQTSPRSALEWPSDKFMRILTLLNLFLVVEIDLMLVLQLISIITVATCTFVKFPPMASLYIQPVLSFDFRRVFPLLATKLVGYVNIM